MAEPTGALSPQILAQSWRDGRSVGFLVRAQGRVHVLGVGSVRTPGEADEVGERHRHDLRSTLGAGTSRLSEVSAPQAELRTLGVPLIAAGADPATSLWPRP